MAKTLVSDELWKRIEPLIPPPKPRRFRFPGRKPLEPRKVLTGIIFVLKTGIAWESLPVECGWGCGLTCKRCLRRWQRQGVWPKLHEALLAELNGAERLDWSRALIDSASARAPCGGQDTGPNPTDRGKLGSKHHVLTDARGIPLAMTLTGANRHDVTQLLPLVDAVPAARGRRGRPRRRPRRARGDRAYDSEPHRRELRRRGLRRWSRSGAPSTAAAWEHPGGSSSGRCLGRISSVDSDCAGIDSRRSTRRLCPSHAR